MDRGERLICASADLAEGGLGVRFRIADGDDMERGFAVRFLGKVRAYVNECPHAFSQLDWEPGEFFDLTGFYLICATHGARFEPTTGKCIAGPCRNASLRALAVAERDGQVFLLGPAAP